MTVDKTAIRNAATIIVMREMSRGPSVLMGQRGAKAVFMPNKFVFPGGAVDPGDKDIELATPLPELCRKRVCEECTDDLSNALAVAAIRELWEETGQILGQRGTWSGTPPADWASFAARGYVPTAQDLQFVFRAITPVGRPRRFDARFFLLDAEALVSDPDDFSSASDELSHLQWVPLAEVRNFELPFITEVVLAEIAKRADLKTPPASVPFFRNDDESSLMRRLGREVSASD